MEVRYCKQTGLAQGSKSDRRTRINPIDMGIIRRDSKKKGERARMFTIYVYVSIAQRGVQLGREEGTHEE